MNTQEIQAFLYIIECGSISKAAEKLFISQSTISNRLINLEKEVGGKLINRSQGIKEISLTPKGKKFINFANRYMSFIKDYESWKNESSVYKLKVSGPASINFYTLKEFYTELVIKPFPFILELTVHWNKTIYDLVENFTLDIGIVSRTFPSPNLITDPLFSEKMVMVSNSSFSNYSDEVNAEELNVFDEVNLDWGPEFSIWHDSIWSPYLHSKVIVDSPQLILWYLNIVNSWAIVPYSVALDFQKNDKNIQISEINPSLPNRVIYKIKQRNTTPSCEYCIEVYEKELINYLKTNNNIIKL